MSSADCAPQCVRFRLQSLEGIDIHIGPQYMTREYLKRLFQIEKPVILKIHEDGELDIIDIGDEFDTSVLDASVTYHCVGEEFANDDDEPTAPPTPEEWVEQRKKAKERLDKMQEERLALIAEDYTPKHPHIYTYSDEFLEEGLRAALADGSDDALKALLKAETDNTALYSLDMFSVSFCETLIDELLHFEQSGLPCVRPNSMNNYGLVLEEINFGPMITDLMASVIVPYAAILYPFAPPLDTHHAFIVQYRVGEDVDLGFHYDESEITLNVCLGKEFEGGTLYFKGLLLEPSTHDEDIEITHVPGRGLLHIGKHRHGANAILSGERYNLIVWCRSSVADSAQQVCACHGHAHGSHEGHDHHH